MSDAQTDAVIVRADMRMDRAQAVVPRMSATGFHTAFAGRDVQFIVKHHHIVGRQFVKPHRLAHGLTGQVHEGFGFQQDNLFTAQTALGHLRLKLGPPRREPVVRRDLIHGHKADVVAVLGVFRTGVSQSDEQSHVAAPFPLCA